MDDFIFGGGFFRFNSDPSAESTPTFITEPKIGFCVVINGIAFWEPFAEEEFKQSIC